MNYRVVPLECARGGRSTCSSLGVCDRRMIQSPEAKDLKECQHVFDRCLSRSN